MPKKPPKKRAQQALTENITQRTPQNKHHYIFLLTLFCTATSLTAKLVIPFIGSTIMRTDGLPQRGGW
jgi:hypothetical protein